MNKHILFVHIPKTAGTSFRLAAQKYFGEENTFYDYSPASVETSPSILNYVYEENDMYKFAQMLKKNKQVFLSGHFNVTKYMPLFETLNVITFIRNPVNQVVSHYQHYCRDLNYKEDFLTFIKDKRFKNVQSRMLRGKPLKLYGFVGLTEKYEESIELINYEYDLDLEIIKTNISSEKGSVKVELDDDLVSIIEVENQDDVNLYEKAQKIFNDRVESFKANKPYIHLFVHERTENKIRGIATQRKTDKPVMVTVADGDKKVNINAKSFRAGMLNQKLPRDGFVGFEYNSKNLNKVNLI